MLVVLTGLVGVIKTFVGLVTVDGAKYKEQLSVIGVELKKLGKVLDSFSALTFLQVGIHLFKNQVGVAGILFQTSVDHGHGLFGIAQTVVASGKVTVNLSSFRSIILHLCEIGQSRVVVFSSQSGSGGQVQHLVGIGTTK